MTNDLRKVATEYSKQYPKIVDENRRRRKGAKIASILKHELSDVSVKTIVDVGASGCIPLVEVAKVINPSIAIGIDLDKACMPKPDDHLKPVISDATILPFRDESIDVLICNHVYEHVVDSNALLSELWRVVKPGGIVYFGAMNARWPIEPHYNIPMLHFMPPRIAEFFVRKKGYDHGYLEKPLSKVALEKLVHAFDLVDYTVQVIENPDYFGADDVINSKWFGPSIRKQLAKLFYDWLPSYLWILRKSELK
jgi:ubiquinone/menaquinone biosynthesis C-methylase UbiE